MAHETTPPVNLLQVNDQLKADWPDRVLPDGWGLVSQTNDQTVSIIDPFGVFTDDEIHHACEQIVFDPDYGTDPDHLWLRDNGAEALDVLIQSSTPEIADLAKVVRAMLRKGTRRPDAAPTF